MSKVALAAVLALALGHSGCGGTSGAGNAPAAETAAPVTKPPEPAPIVAEPTPPAVGRFTVRQHQIYRAVIDAPVDLSHARAFQRVASAYKMTADEVRLIVDMVQQELFEQGWSGRPEDEIRHASDWNGPRR